VIAIAALPSVASFWFAQAARQRKLLWPGSATAIVLIAFAFTNTVLFQQHRPILHLTWVGGQWDLVTYESSPSEYEQWNAFSRIKISRRPGNGEPVGWGFSPTLPKDIRVEQMDLRIDAAAYSVLTRYNGDPKQVEYLKYDLTNLAHYARQNADVLVVGVGGGRDILSALAFGQNSVTGVEINNKILHAVNDVYGAFTGHLDRDPRVTFVNDEARSYVARSKNKYDIIQLSLTDTWAATSSGAFALSENSLYTVEAWDTFLDHLNPNGFLSVSRFYWPGHEMEGYRLAALATKALQERGVANPRDHIYMAGVFPITTILVSPTPLSKEDIAALDSVVQKMEFERVITPDYSGGGIFADIVGAKDVNAFVSDFPVNISAPTDNSPFFFQMIRLKDLFRGDLPNDKSLTEPVLVLAGLTIAVLVLTFLFIILPLLLTARRMALKGMLPFFIFFAAIGLGFLLIEISQMQRLNVFLGHPIYGLAVVLFSLLLFSGIGSFATERFARPGPQAINLLPFAFLIPLLVLFGFLTPILAHHYDSATTPLRILTAVGILAPMGLVMGMPFPIGMKAVSAWPDAPTPFFWGINGATSVCASVLAVAISLSWGISAAFWVGCVCYCAAAAGLAFALLRGRP
jgi:hypothetical protein